MQCRPVEILSLESSILFHFCVLLLIIYCQLLPACRLPLWVSKWVGGIVQYITTCGVAQLALLWSDSVHVSLYHTSASHCNECIQ